MLQPADLHGATTAAVLDDAWVQIRPPQPGGGDRYPSAELRRGEGTVSATVVVDAEPTVVVEYVATYRSYGARRYLRDLRLALDSEQRADERNRRWIVLAAGLLPAAWWVRDAVRR